MERSLRQKYNSWHLKLEKKPRENGFSKWVLDLLKVSPNERLLDVGCGGGFFCKAASKRGLDIYGVDLSDVAIQRAKEIIPNANFTIGDAGNMGYKDNFFDYVTCLGSLEHFSNMDRAIQEMRRVLKQDGKAFVFLPNSYFIGHIYMVCRDGRSPDEGGQHFSERFGTKVEWLNLLESNELKVIEVYKFNTIWASVKISLFAKYIYNYVIKPFIPFNLSYGFGYICKKVDK